MDFISIHTVQSLGIGIIHSFWQIGLITFMYFFFILRKKNLSVNHKYSLGLSSFVLILVVFIFTFHAIDRQNSYQLPTTTELSDRNNSYNLQLINLPEKEVVETQDNINFLDVHYFKFRDVINLVAGVVGALWIIGIAFFILRKILAYFYLKRLKNNKYNVRSKKWEQYLIDISTRLNLKKHIDILFSPLVNGPLSFGFFKPVILFPLRITTGLSTEEIKCILIHELAHNLRNDFLYNIFQHVIETLFFYHPGIWWMSKNIRTQREIICDKIVLHNKVSEKYYAHTLLKLGELQLSDSNMAIAANRSNTELFTRIKHIISKPDEGEKRKGNPLLAIVFVMAIILSAFVFKGKGSSAELIILNGEIKKNISQFNGSFVCYDFRNDAYFSSNDSLCNIRFPAYSTFKIASSLIALDMGIAKNGSYTIQYDSIKYPITEWMKKNDVFRHWNENHNITTALEYSVNWYFNELGEQIGNDNMVEYMEKLSYGNQRVSTGAEQAWYNGQLKISAIEQLEFIKNILKLECKGISEHAQRITKEVFPGEVKNYYSLYGKTGTGELDDNSIIGWYVGFLETRENTYAFALNMFAGDYNEIHKNTRHKIVKNIFADLGLINK